MRGAYKGIATVPKVQVSSVTIVSKSFSGLSSCIQFNIRRFAKKRAYTYALTKTRQASLFLAAADAAAVSFVKDDVILAFPTRS